MLVEVNSVNELTNIYCENSSIVDFDFKSNPYRKYIIYVESDNIVGFLCYEDIFDRYEIDNIFVELSNRRKGIANDLLNRLIEIGNINKIKNITLEVNEKNIPAISLYEKNGFKKKAIRKNYYDGVDGILMEKEMI